MKTTYSAAEARSNFSEILSQVAFAKSSVIIKRYGEPIAKIMPADKKASNRDVNKIIDKYYGIWENKSWAENIGKPSRYFRKR